MTQREIEERKARFAELNAFVRSRGGWLTSIPGDVEVTMECLPGSTLPDELRDQGFDLVEGREGERILPAAIEQKFVTGTDGELEPLTTGSTRAVTMTVTNAGIAKVVRYSFAFYDASAAGEPSSKGISRLRRERTCHRR